VRFDWWERIAGLRERIGACAFVRTLADGTLHRDAFVWYLTQDAFYLRAYAPVLAAAASLAPSAAERDFWASSADSTIAVELAMQERWLAGGDPAAAVPSATTTAYLDHLRAAADAGDYDPLVAAVLPCYWLYADIGLRLRAAATPGHPYAGWLRTYGDPGFAAATRRAVGVVKRRFTRADEPTRTRMWAAFRTSAEHELAFFDAPLLRR